MLKKLARSIRAYKKQTLLTPVLMIGEVSCECVIPLITKNLIDGIQAGADMNDIIKWGLMLVAMAFVSLFFGVAAGKLCATASTGFAKNLRQDLYYRIQDFSFANIDHFSAASLVTRLTTDVQNVQMSFMMIIRTAVRAPLMLVFATVMSVKAGGRLAWVFAGFLPLLAVGLLVVTKLVMPIFRTVFKKYDGVNNAVQENIKGIRVVKTFVREAYEKAKFDASSEMLRRDFLKAERIIAFAAPFMMLAMYGSMLLISYFAAKIVISSAGVSLQIGTLSSMLTYSMQILMSLMMLSMIFVMVTMSVASAKRIVEVLDTETDLPDPAGTDPDALTEVADGRIDFERVSFKYSAAAERDSLSDIDLHIPAGATVGVIGGTGAGKSTLVQLIPRLYDATKGRVLVGGKDVKQYSLTALRNSVSMVLQKNVLFSGTVRENLRWGDPDATDEMLIRACTLAQADEFIHAFPDGYDTHIEQGGANVSGGQKQRLCIARALLKKPKILILDDSTSAVDTATDAKIRQAFREELPGVTKLIIAQRVSSVQDADMIVVMHDGGINGVGTHETLMKENRIYREVWESQNRGGEQNG